MVWFKFKVMSF